MVGHPQGGRCASTVHDMAVCILRRVVGCAGGGGGSQVPCSGRDAMEVRRGHGDMHASLEQTLQHRQHVRPAGFDRADHRTGILSCVLAMIQGSDLALI